MLWIELPLELTKKKKIQLNRESQSHIFNLYTSVMCLFLFKKKKQIITPNHHFYQVYRPSSVTALCPQGTDKSSALSHGAHMYPVYHAEWEYSTL